VDTLSDQLAAIRPDHYRDELLIGYRRQGAALCRLAHVNDKLLEVTGMRLIRRVSVFECRVILKAAETLALPW
jgi:hypothetical protein